MKYKGIEEKQFIRSLSLLVDPLAFFMNLGLFRNFVVEDNDPRKWCLYSHDHLLTLKLIEWESKFNFGMKTNGICIRIDTTAQDFVFQSLLQIQNQYSSCRLNF